MHRLALALGRTVAELEESISPAELNDWAAFYALEPWGFEWQRLMNAQLMASVYNAAGAKPALKPSDFLPDEHEDEHNGELTAEALAAMLRAGCSRSSRSASEHR